MNIKNVIVILLVLFMQTVVCDGKSQSEKRLRGRAPSGKMGHKKSSLVFVFDITGSMWDDLRQLRSGAELILDAVLQSQTTHISNFVLVPFGDPDVGPATVTDDRRKFKAALNKLELYGGGDCPEMSLSGIQMALNVSLPGSHVYVFTDASSADYFIVNNVLDLIQRKQSQVVFVLTGDCKDRDKPNFKVYNKITAASSGQVFNLKKTNVHKVLEYVKSSVTGRMVNLGTVVNPAGYNFTQKIPVDSSLGEVTVSVSGSKPKIKVVNPSGEEIDGPPKLITTLDLAEIMVVKVMDPEPGNWSITVGSQDDYSVKVTGLSNLTFNHGFSVQPPISARETSHRPLQGADNYLTISLQNVDKPLEMLFAEVVSLDGKPLFELPLKLLDEEEHLYLTEPFLPPDTFFHIAINGLDENKQEVRRIGATAVHPQLPDVPFLTVEPEVSVYAHDTVVLQCAAESLVPLTAQWTKDIQRLQNKTSSLQSTIVEYTIKEMSAEKAGVYKCVASNVAGLSKAYTNVTLLVDPPMVELSPQNVSLVSRSNITVICSVYSEAPLLSFQFKTPHEKGNITSPTIKDGGTYVYNYLLNATDKASGTYICQATNQGGKTVKTTNIQVLKALKATSSSRYIQVSLGGKVQLFCRFENAESVEWKAPNGTVMAHTENIGIDKYDSVYNIHRVSHDIDGNWTCVAKRDLEQALDTVSVEVILKPEVHIAATAAVTLFYGTSFSATCSVFARPRPSIIWEDPHGNYIDPNREVQELVAWNYTRLFTINNVTESDEGLYFCSAENIVGVDRKSIKIDVRRNITVLEVLKDQQVKIYTKANLTCKVSGYPKPDLKWYVNGTHLKPNENLVVSNDNTTLTIVSMNFDSAGQYACKATNQYESIIYNATISLTGLEVPVLSKEPAKISAKETSSLEIPCRLRQGIPSPKFSWMYRENNTVDYRVIPDGFGVDKMNSVLNFINLILHHGGMYKCDAENVIGSDYYEVSLVILYPPRLEEGTDILSKLIDVIVGTKVVLFCNAVSVPAPLIVWTKDGLPISYSDNVHLLDNGSLILNAATEFDAGLFSYNASNAIGSTVKNFTVSVFEPARIAANITKEEIEVVEGQLVELFCSAQGLPRPVVHWEHEGAPVIDERKQIDEQFTLRFVANLTDFGDYTCVATNRAGNQSRTFSLFVWVSPYIELGHESVIETVVGKTVSLVCNAVGFPVPIISWQFNNEMLTQNTSSFSFNDSGNLNLSNVTVKSEGVYCCIAENIAGFTHRDIHLTVNEPPQIKSDNYTGSYLAIEGDVALNIPCRATGKPMPFVSWTKDGENLLRDSRYFVDIDGTLTLLTPSQDMSADYICEVMNSVGSDQKSFSVEIYSAPVVVQAEEQTHIVKMVEGTSDKLQCPVRYTDIDSVKWYKDGQLLGIGELQFPNVSRWNVSLYACVVSNAVGSASSVFQVEVEWSPHFLNPEVMSTVEVIQGEDCYFDCDVDAKPNAEVKWLFNSNKLASERHSRLALRDVQLHHGGQYACVVSNNHGTVARRHRLVVLVPPNIFEFRVLDVQLGEGVSTTLACKASGIPKPKITWIFNNTDWSIQNDSLVTLNVTSKSGGSFTCVASNKAGVATLEYRVTVISPAIIKEIIIFNQSLSTTVLRVAEVMLGENIRLACEGDGIPLPEIRWIRNGKKLSHNVLESTYADLILENVQKHHAGPYTCSVENDAGRQERHIHLEVLDSPKIFKTLFTTSNTTEQATQIEIGLNQPFYLHCHPYGNPIPQIYWFKDGQPLQFYSDKMLTRESGEVLVSNSASVEQGGNYTCVARNKVGMDNITYVVNVLVPPLLLKGNSTIAVRSVVGGRIQLLCPVEGQPAPSVVWLKHPYTEIDTAQFPNIYFPDQDQLTSTLVINSTILSDNGKYSCVVTNKVGTSEIIFEVTVEKAPVILSNDPLAQDNSETLIVPIRRSVVLQCQVEGFPEPKLTWLKDTLELGHNLSHLHRALGNTVLTVWNVRVNDAGQYICIAENSAGTAHRRFNLRVQVPGKWSNWTNWSLCNVTCGVGIQSRARECRFMGDESSEALPQHGISTEHQQDIVIDESACKGRPAGIRKCHLPSCEDDSSEDRTGEWSAWSRWSLCSASCGSGSQSRKRRCRFAPCVGDNVQIRKCRDLPDCAQVTDSNETADTVNGTDNLTTFSKESLYLPDVTFENQPKSIDGIQEAAAEYFDEDSTHVQTVKYYNVNISKDVIDSSSKLCTAGYYHDSVLQQCTDVDECAEVNRCHRTQTCENLPGAYRCYCQQGYTSLGLGQRCIDINECEVGSHSCEYACVNVAGGYVCACPHYLRMHSDKRHCISVSSYKAYRSSEELSSELMGEAIDMPKEFKEEETDEIRKR